jgi:hypothetical protein
MAEFDSDSLLLTGLYSSSTRLEILCAAEYQQNGDRTQTLFDRKLAANVYTTFLACSDTVRYCSGCENFSNTKNNKFLVVEEHTIQITLFNSFVLSIIFN